MEQNKQQHNHNIQIRATDTDLKGVYSNIMQVMHTGEEFVMDFFNVVGNQGVLTSRVVMNPAHVKRMLHALSENMKIYEEKFGPVTAAEQPKEKFGF